MKKTWQQFLEQIKERPNWNIKIGEAHYFFPSFTIRVFPFVPRYTLQAPSERVALCLSNVPVEYEYSLEGDPYGHVAFQKEWAILWDEIVPLHPQKKYPPGFAHPKPLQLKHQEMKHFSRDKISSTSVAPLFGQGKEVLGEKVAHYDAGPSQGEEGVTYRQEWIALLYCPFCGMSDWTNCESYYPSTTDFYGNDHLVLLCPRCERVCTSHLP